MEPGGCIGDPVARRAGAVVTGDLDGLHPAFDGDLTSGVNTRPVTFTAGASGKVTLPLVVPAGGGCPSTESQLVIPIRALRLDPFAAPVTIGATNTFTGPGFTAGSAGSARAPWTRRSPGRTWRRC